MLSLWLGLLIGLVHAFEADHIAAIAAITTKAKSVKRSTLLGIWWGLGHTTALLAVGLLVLLFKYSIPTKAFTYFEAAAAIAVIYLGCSVLFETFRHNIHYHTHQHNETIHSHLHSHLHGKYHSHQHAGLTEARRSVFVGLLHGLAGSGVLLLAIVATSKSVITGLSYIILFGMGSIMGMAIASTIISLPLIFSTAKYKSWLQRLTGLAGMAIGCTMLFNVLYFA